ncbi:MAG: Brp/Blh family beta-carotene 15,15'-dioxygenase [Acidobacteriota bacterium]
MLPELAESRATPPLRPDRPSSPHWWSAHWKAALLLTLASAVALAVASPSLAMQLIVLSLGVALLGVPHGALDPVLGRTLLQERWGSRWWIVFTMAYLLLAGAVLICWKVSPAASLGGFLLISVVHFGLGDVPPAERRGWRGTGQVMVRGLLPIALPVWAQPGQVSEIFGWLAGASAPSASELATLGAVGGALISPLGLWWVLHHGRRSFGGDSHSTREILEVSALILLALVAPPLLFFVVYFCLWHSLRHSLETADERLPGGLSRALRAFVRQAIPMTVLTMIAAVVAWWGLQVGGAVAPSEATVQVIFIGLAALTVPHMMLCFAVQHRDRSPA